ncbi:MAG: tetratricopeptide repeat-containing sensor histidine kinase, partial [Chitinophagales bacterium]
MPFKYGCTSMMVSTKLHFSICAYLLATFLFSATTLATQAQTKTAIETTVNQLLESADSTKQIDINQSILTANKALDLAEQQDLFKSSIKACLALGDLYFLTNQYAKSEEYYQLALSKTNKRDDKSSKLLALVGWAFLLERKGEYQSAIETSLEANKLAYELKDRTQEAKINTNIAHIYYNYGDIDKAIEFLNNSKKIYEETKNMESLSGLYNNLAILHRNNNNNQQAKTAFLEAIRIGHILKDEIGVARTYDNLGLLSILENQLDSAENYLLKALNTFNKIGIKPHGVYYNFGRLFLEKKDFVKAEENILRALELYEKEDMKIEPMKSRMLLALIYEQKKDYKKAYEQQKKVEKIKDDLFDVETSKAVELVENKYQLQQSELKVMELDRTHQQRKYILIGLGTMIFFALLFGFMLFRQKDLKNKKERLLLEQKLLRSQMNPHFIFNALSVIQSFIFKNKPKDAGRYLAKFSMLIRLILENSRKEYVPLDEEIASLEYYLDLQQLRFQDKFDYEIHIDEQIIPEETAIAPMLTQPFIENAIEHGIQYKEGKGLLTIHFELKNDLLYFILTDDGIGLAKAAQYKNQKETHQSLSTQITKERLMIYQQKKKMPCHLEITDRLDDTHT